MGAVDKKNAAEQKATAAAQVAKNELKKETISEKQAAAAKKENKDQGKALDSAKNNLGKVTDAEKNAKETEQEADSKAKSSANKAQKLNQKASVVQSKAAAKPVL